MEKELEVLHYPAENSKFLVFLCSNGTRLIFSVMKIGRVTRAMRLDMKRIGELIPHDEYSAAVIIAHKIFRIKDVRYKPMLRKNWASYHCIPESIPRKNKRAGRR